MTTESNNYYVYLLESTDGCTYIGATVDLDHRLRQHNCEIKGWSCCHIQSSEKRIHMATRMSRCWISIVVRRTPIRVGMEILLAKITLSHETNKSPEDGAGHVARA